MKRLLPVVAVLLFGLTALRTGAQPFSLANTSALVTLGPGGTASIGFVVQGTVSSSNPSSTVMIRAVGPTLGSFGIGNPVAMPQFTISDPGATLIFLGQIDWNATFASVGAFPLTGGETTMGAVWFYALPPGAYSVQVSDHAGKGGVVLVEVYMNVKVSTVPGGPL